MTLAPSTIERCLEVLGSLVRGLPELNGEFEASIEAFFQGSRPGAAGDPRETLLAGRRHLEWFLLEYHSATLRGSVAEKLTSSYEEFVESSLAEDDDQAAHQAALTVAIEALLRSHTGIFEVESSDAEEAVWARDLGGFGTYALMTTGLEGRLRHGDLLVGRLYPAGDGGNVASPTIAIVRSEGIRTALTRDLGRVREESSVNVLRIGQRELEAMFFVESEGEQPPLPADARPETSDPEPAPQDPTEAALGTLREVGFDEPMAREALRVLASTPRDPDRLVHGLEDPVAEVMETLAFETDVDLGEARTALIAAWELVSAGSSPSPRIPGLSPTAGEVNPEEAVDAFARGRERGEDAASLLQKLEEDLGIAGDGAADEGSEAPAPDFPGVVGAMVDEMRWEMTATRDGFNVDTLAPLKHLANFAQPIGVFEELKGRDLFQFTTFWLQETRALTSDAEAVALVAALREFCEWALDAHEVDLGSEFLDALGGLETSLPRMRRANEALVSGGASSQEGEGEGYEVLSVGAEQPGSFETSGDRMAPRGGGDSLTVILPEALRSLVLPGDYVRATISLEGHATVFSCYPPEARSLMGG